ncbi:MUTAGEN-SENSITIVE 101 [Ceraceosorus bombacis]|uniref:MUTAGEN-SENSITIVE 101 n=1 Tax=Ceraceosorus bombacis TaxID=401625 RepID=A0A0P1BLN2_9BASI|nr:MUTAGEN-SENSITIVE 101 [Ceraceosorus bombacis]
MSSLNRSARAHRSTKVPNAILRPAPPNVGASGSSKSARAFRSEADNAEADAHFRALRQAADQRAEQMDEDSNWNEKPLLGAVIGFSGLGDRKNHYQQMARDLGAEARSDMPENTHFLLAVEPLSEKCTRAVDAGIRIVQPRWLEEVKRRWCHDEPVDIDGLATEYALDTFATLNVVLAGFHDAEERRDIRTRMIGAGAECPRDTDLAAGGHTHVLCSSTAKSESITLKSVLKFKGRAERYIRRSEKIPTGAPDAAQMLNAIAMHCVVLEWMQDSLEVGGCLDSTRYELNKFSLQPADRRSFIDATLRNRTRVAEDFKARHASAVARSVAQDVSTEGDERVSIQRATQQANNPNILRKIIAQASDDGPEGLAQPDKAPLGGSREHAFGDHGEQSKEKGAQAAQGTKHIQTEIKSSQKGPKAAHSPQQQGEPASFSTKGVFAGLAFTLDLVESKFQTRVAEQIVRYGGRVLPDAQAHHAQYCVVECCSSPECPTSSSPNALQVTIWWIERCIHLNNLEPIDSTPFARPSTPFIPQAVLKGLRISITQAGHSVDDSQSSRVLQVLGVIPSSSFGRGRYTHLYCGSDEGGPEVSRSEKVKAAREWGVPIVGAAFVRRLYEEGIVDPPGAPLSSCGGQQNSQVLPDSLATTVRRTDSECSNKASQMTQSMAMVQMNRPKQVAQKKAPQIEADVSASATHPVTATQIAWESVNQSMVGQLAADELAGLLNGTRSTTTEKVKRPTSADLLSRSKSRKGPPSRSGSKRATSIGSGTGRDGSTSPEKGGRDDSVDSGSVSPSKSQTAEGRAEELVQRFAQHEPGNSDESKMQATRICWEDPNAKRGMLQLQQMMAASIPSIAPTRSPCKDEPFADHASPRKTTNGGKRSTTSANAAAQSFENASAKRARLSHTAAKAAVVGAKNLSPSKNAYELDDQGLTSPSRQVLARKQPNSRA